MRKLSMLPFKTPCLTRRLCRLRRVLVAGAQETALFGMLRAPSRSRRP